MQVARPGSRGVAAGVMTLALARLGRAGCRRPSADLDGARPPEDLVSEPRPTLAHEQLRPSGEQVVARAARTLLALALIFTGTVAGLVGTTGSANAGDGTVVGPTILTTNTTWPASGSPYRVQGAVQVAAGATLTFEAGAKVEVDSTIQLEGGLTVAGTATDPVIIQTDVALFRGIGAYTEPSRKVNITHANIIGPGPLTGSDTKYLGFTMTDSKISDITSTNYIWYPTSLLFERNVFTRVNTIEIGTNRVSAVIRNNRFRQAPASGFRGYNGSSQIVSWAAYGTPLQVTGNVFDPTVRPRILQVSIDGNVDASGNYFASTDPTEVKTWVRDKEDDLSLPSVVDVDPLLAAPPAEVPAVEPSQPQSLAASRADQAVSLSWQPPANDGGAALTGYRVTVTPGDRILDLPADTTTTTIDGLANGTSYSFEVTAQNPAGLSPAATVSATPATVPGTPTEIIVQPVDGGALIRWSPAADNGAPITGHEITVQPGGQTITVGPDNRAGVGSLTNGVAYTFTVRAINDLGPGPWSPATNEVIPATAPSKVQNVHATTGNGSATVAWDPSDSNGSPVDAYLVVASPGSARATVDGDTNSAVIRGLTNGQKYTFTVMAHNSMGASPPSAPSAPVVPATTPGQATQLHGAVKNATVTLTWKKPGNGGTKLTGYVVTDNGKTVATIAGAAAVRATKYVARHVADGRHRYRIRAANAIGTGPWSKPVSVRMR